MTRRVMLDCRIVFRLLGDLRMACDRYIWQHLQCGSGIFMFYEKTRWVRGGWYCRGWGDQGVLCWRAYKHFRRCGIKPDLGVIMVGIFSSWWWTYHLFVLDGRIFFLVGIMSSWSTYHVLVDIFSFWWIYHNPTRHIIFLCGYIIILVSVSCFWWAYYHPCRHVIFQSFFWWA